MGNKSFSEYYAEALSNLPAAPAQQPTLKPPTFAGTAKRAAEAKPFNFLDWGLDILSRPLYAVTEQIETALETPEDARAAQQRIQSGESNIVNEALGRLGKQATAGVRGFFSTDEDDKSYTADLIEKGTDVVGRETDPMYEDVEDNASPIIKGVAGFAGDVALDPLTWVPGGIVASLGKKALAGVKSGKEAVDTAIQSRKAPEPETVPAEAPVSAAREAEQADIDAMASMPEPIAPPKKPTREPTEIEAEIEEALQTFVKKPKEQQVAEDIIPEAPITTTRVADDLTSDVPTPKVDRPDADGFAASIAELRKTIPMTKAGRPNKNAIRAALRELDKDPRIKELLDVEFDVDGETFLGRSWVEDVFNGQDDDMVHLRSMFDDAIEATRPADEVAEAADEVIPAGPTSEPVAQNVPRDRQAALSAFNAGIRAQRSAKDVDPASFGEYADAFDAGLSAGAASGAKLSRAESNAMFEDWFKAGDEIADEAPVGAVDEGPATVREAVDEVEAEAPPRESLMERAEGTEEFAATQRLLEAIGPRKGEGPTFGDFLKEKALDPKTAKLPAVNANGMVLSWRDVPKFLQGGDKTSELYAEVRKQLNAAWKRKAAAAKGQATKWNKLPPVVRYSEIVKTEDGRALAERALGEALTNRFDKITNAGKFDALMAEIGAVVSRVLNLDEITKESIKFDTTRAALKRFGIDEDDLPVEAVSPTSHVTEAVGAAQQAADLTRPAAPASATQSVVESMAVPEGGKTLAERSARLTPAERDVAEVVTRVIGEDVFGIGLPKGRKRPYKTKEGAARTHKEAGKGFAVWEGRINGPTQHNISTGLFNSLADTLKTWRNAAGNTLNAGKEYAVKKKALYMERSEMVHRMLDREGVAQHLGIKSDDAMLSDYQLRSVLDATDSDVSTMLLYNIPTGVPTTNLYEAVSAMLRGAPDDEITEILVKQETAYRQGMTETYLNPLAGDGRRVYGHRIFKNGPPPAPNGAKWVKNDKPGVKNGYYLQYDAKVLQALTLRLLRQAKPRLQQLAQQNANARKARIDVETAELTAAERAWLEEIVTDPAKMGAAIRATAEPEVTVQKMAQDAGATQESVTLASINAVTDIPVPDKIVSTGAAEAADTVKRTGDPQSAKATSQKTQERLIDDTDEELLRTQQEALANAAKMTDDELVDAGVADEVADISRKTQVQVDISIAHAMNPNINGLLARMGKALKANFGFERISRFRHNAEVASAMRRSAFINQIGKLVAEHGGVVKGATSTTNSLLLKRAWNSLRTGAPVDNPDVNAARAALEQLFGQLFDTTRRESILGNSFFRNPVSVDHVNGELAAVGLKDAHGQPILFDLAAGKAKAEQNGTDLMTEVIEQWRTWDIADPAEAMLKLFAASERVATRAVIGQNFNKFAAAEGLFSTTPKPGFAQPMASGKSIFISMLKQDGYYDAEILKELSRLEAFMSASRSFDGGIGKFIHGFFDPMQQSWKFGMTVVRPGHHVRNLVGDASMTYLAEGMRFARKSNTDAIRVLTAMHNKYDGYDFNRAMEGLGLKEVPGSSDVLFTSPKGRKLTVGQIYEAYYTRGLQNSYRHSEDVLDEGLAPEGFARLMNRLSLRGGKVEHIAGSISQARDHYARMQHFLQYIYKAEKDGRSFRSIDELFDAAAHQVKKYHPDGSMLTPFESKYMRRIIPFYSWLRGAIPAIIESSALKPSRMTVFPKASMNLAIAMGVNPDSLANPFPEDQLFPSFLTDQVFGPQFGNARDGYFGFSPGIATVDVANQFLAGKPGEATLRGLAGSTSPIFRVPAELMSGGAWGTGARINDASDYIDSTLPGINYLSNITGYSVTGSLVGGLTGQGADEQLQIARENKTDTDKMLSVLNWLTGASVQNQSRPNYINYAEIEKRNAAAQAGEESRNAF